jgi:hypothetical protein
MTDIAAPSPALRASRWRTHLDRVLVAAIIIALWSRDLAIRRLLCLALAVAIRFVDRS